MNNLAQNETLESLSDEERLKVYQLIVDGCSHIWSKNTLQADRLQKALDILIPLTQKDPLFLAHLTSYIFKKSDNRDLQVLTTFANSLNSADGTPFSVGSKYNKPNLRYVSAAAVQLLDPKSTARVSEVANRKFAIANILNMAEHNPRILKNALIKYLQYRGQNLNILRGIKKAGLAHAIVYLYKRLHQSPSDEVAAILRWEQKDREIKFEDTQFNFKDKTDLEIAESIRTNKLPVLTVLGALPRQISPVIAVALLEQASGNQAVILRKTFEEAGVLKDPEVMALYTEKVKSAKSALDRVEVVTESASEAVKQVLKSARAEKRKEATAGIGKIFLHLDASGSMDETFEVARKRGALLAEMVDNPKENFMWGAYNTSGAILPLPEEFVEDAFAAILFGARANGGTDCFALYPEARRFGADIDIHVSDGAHNTGDLGEKIRRFHEQYPDLAKPKACVIIQVRGVDLFQDTDALKRGYEKAGIPVSVIKPETLTESALVNEAIKTALVGPLAIIEEIMNTKLLELPNWYFTV